MKKRWLPVVLGSVLAVVPTASAFAEGPSLEVFDGNDATWGCSGDAGVALPPNHCINLRSQGSTGVIKVFSPDPRWPQESVSTDEKSDTRPCPHDPAADPDGTWWSPQAGLWVCHHRP